MGSVGVQPVSIAVIGAGTIGRMHAAIIERNQDTRLVAIVDPTSSGEELAKQYGCKCFHDVTTLLDSMEHLDAAIVCTPNETHVQISMLLARRRVHLLIEKPMSVSVQEGRQLLDLCHAEGIRVSVGHHRRFHSSIAAARKTLDAGEIGQVIGVSGLWTTLKAPSYFQGNGEWRTKSSGGVVHINLIHDIDLLQYLLGPVIRVFAERAPSTRGHEAEEGVAVTLRFATGAVGTFLALDNSPSPFSIERGTGENPVFPFSGKDSYRLFGKLGVMSVPDGLLWNPVDLAKGWYSKINETHLKHGNTDVYVDQLTNFVNVVHGLEQPRCDGEAGLQAVAACEAVLESLKTGMPVHIVGVLANQSI